MSHRSPNPWHKALTRTEIAYVSYMNQRLRQIFLEFSFMVLLTQSVARADKVLIMYLKVSIAAIELSRFSLILRATEQTRRARS